MSKTIRVGRILNLYWKHAWRHPKLVVGALISLPTSVLVQDLLPPLVLAHVLGRLTRGDFVAGNVWESFGPTLVGFALLLTLGAIGWRVVDAFMWRLEGKVGQDLADRVYGHVLSQSANFHANTFGGSLVSQNNKLLGSYVRIADTTVYETLNLASVLVFSIVILLPRSPIYVAALLVFSIVYITSAFFITRPVRDIGAEHASSESRQTGYLADSVANVMAIKAFSGLPYEKEQYRKHYSSKTHQWLLKYMHVHQRQLIFFGAFNRVIEFSALLVAIITVVVLKADVATVFLIFSYTGLLIGKLWQFSNSALRNYNRSLGDASEMVEILHHEAEVKDPIKPEVSRIKDGEIELKNVTFTHDGARDTLFNDFNLNIKPGEKVGLVGHSGSGKTSLTRILLRFSDIDGGEILLDGQNIANITQDDLRRNIAYVPQEPLLFHRSLTDNIRYGRPEASEKEILEASKMAHADDFIKTLPLGYETLVGERGVKLSGGQRQRVAIARAMIKDAPILVLDEATSALDSESEVLIQQALWKLMEGRTAIVIAHRLSTVQKMDRIVVMDDGKVVEEGTHRELLTKQNGVYAKLWAHQSGGFLED